MTFDKMFYLQIQGPAMGTTSAPTYATLSMGFHEIDLYTIIRNKFTLPFSNYFEQNWTILSKIFRWLLHIFKIKFNKAKRIARCFKQCQPSYIIYYGSKWYPSPIPWCRHKRFLWIFIQNQPTQKDTSPSNQTTPSIAWKLSHFLLLVEFAWLLKKIL